MTLRISQGVRNALTGSIGLGGIFNKGSIEIYTGTQPVSADAAVTGTLLGRVTLNSAALTREVQASQTITVAGASGSIDTVTVGTLNIIPDGAVAFNTDVTTTAADLCAAINRNGLFTATVASTVVTVKPRPGAGANYNGVAFATTVTTLTATVGAGTLSGGTSAVNALILASPLAGSIAKPTGAVWSFNGLAAGTAGWFRFKGSVLDNDLAISAAPYLARLDGSIAVAGADLNLSNISVAIGAPNTIDSFSATLPANV